MARFSLTCPPWQVISVLHMHNPTVSKRLRYSLNQMHMRAPWRCRGLQMLMHIYCGGLQIPHGDKPMDCASSGSDSSAAENSAADSSNSETMVHITATGKKYHRAGCRTLKKSDTEVTLDEAKSMGLSPCGICNPPQ